MVAPTRVLHSIVFCRIILNLRRAASTRRTTTETLTGLAFATAAGQQMNQAETIQLEAYNATCSDGEGSYRQSDGDSVVT